MDFKNKKVVVCDFSSDYYFPPKGYGGIERWLWTVAKESLNLGMKVIIIGPKWKKRSLQQAIHEPKSITIISLKDFTERYGIVDFLVAGHEYWHNKNLRRKFEKISKKTITFQHMPDPIFKKRYFDRKKHFLFCYSNEMIKRFKLQSPIKELCVSRGYNEKAIKKNKKGYLVWIGRLDKDKIPHIAVLAAKKINKQIYLLGKPIRENDYFKKYKNILKMNHVKRFTSKGCKRNEVTGKNKMDLIAKADCMIYTLNSDYIEAGSAIFADSLSCGVPVAAISWKNNDCSYAALNSKTGVIAKINQKDDQEKIVNKLSKAINSCLKLDRKLVYEIGSKKFNSKNLVKKMYLKTKGI